MQQRDAPPGAEPGQQSGTLGIGAMGGLGVGLRGVHGGVGGGVHQQGRRNVVQHGKTLRPVEVERRPAEPHHRQPLLPGRRLQRQRHLAVAAGH